MSVKAEIKKWMMSKKFKTMRLKIKSQRQLRILVLRPRATLKLSRMIHPLRLSNSLIKKLKTWILIFLSKIKLMIL